MTITGAGGVSITRWRKSKRFHKDYDKLGTSYAIWSTPSCRILPDQSVLPGWHSRMLKGHASPPIYTVHVTGNYKISMEIEGTEAFLRRVAPHDEIDRAP